MRSPICNLEESIAGVAFRIAPEKEKECQKHRDNYGISIDLIDDSEFSIRVNLSSNTIMLPIASLEYLWAFSLYCSVLTQEYSSAQKGGLKQRDTQLFDIETRNVNMRVSHELMNYRMSGKFPVNKNVSCIRKIICLF